MSNALVKQGENGQPAVVWRERDPADHALLKPIADQLQQVIALLGTEDPRLDNALVMLRHALRELRDAYAARPHLEDPERREALSELHRIIRELQEAARIIKRGG